MSSSNLSSLNYQNQINIYCKENDNWEIRGWKFQFLEARQWIAIIGFEKMSDCLNERQLSAPALIILVVGESIVQVHPDAKWIQPIQLKQIKTFFYAQFKFMWIWYLELWANFNDIVEFLVQKLRKNVTLNIL